MNQTESTVHGFPSTGLLFSLILLKIPFKNEKCLSDDNFVVSYPFGLRFRRVSNDGFLFVFLGLLYANGSICGSIYDCIQ